MHICISANIKFFSCIRVVGRIFVKHIILVWWCYDRTGLPSSTGWSSWYGFAGQIHGLRSQETLVSTLDSSLVGFRYYINHRCSGLIISNSCLKFFFAKFAIYMGPTGFGCINYMHPQIFRTLEEDWMRTECSVHSCMSRKRLSWQPRTARKGLQHPYFTEEARPKICVKMPLSKILLYAITSDHLDFYGLLYHDHNLRWAETAFLLWGC